MYNININQFKKHKDGRGGFLIFINCIVVIKI